MKDKLFAELLGSAQEALEHAQGKRELRTTILPEPPAPMTPKEIRRLRKRANASQAVFAHHLNVSSKLAQAWEGGYRRPAGAALKLLRIAESNPDVVFDAFAGTRPSAEQRTILRKKMRRAKKRSLAARAR